jgi:hypothetical protein
MKYRTLALFPLLFAAVFAAVALSTHDHAGVVAALRIENELGKVLALVGSFAAAFAFERGDYLRRAWLLGGLCYLLLLVSDAADWSAIAGALPGRRLELAHGGLAVAANAASVWGTWMLARAWSVAGIDERASRGRVALFAAAAVLSLAITGWPLVYDVRVLAGGEFGAAVSISSDLGDTICLALVAPVLLTALALRGGLLRWPWGLLTASGVAWIAYDGVSGVTDALGLDGAGWLVSTEVWRALACGFVFSAGLAQRYSIDPDEQPSTARRE